MQLHRARWRQQSQIPQSVRERRRQLVVAAADPVRTQAGGGPTGRPADALADEEERHALGLDRELVTEAVLEQGARRAADAESIEQPRSRVAVEPGASGDRVL